MHSTSYREVHWPRTRLENLQLQNNTDDIGAHLPKSRSSCTQE
jgi:hypothetical protein